MAQEFSWLRLRQAVADVWMPAEGVRAMIPRIVAGLTLLGFSIGVYKKPDIFLPTPVVGRVVLALLFLFVLGWNIQVAYSLRSRIDEIKNTAKVHALLPPAQRERVHRIKELAGRICGGLQGIGPTGGLDLWMNQLRDEAGAIREHEAVWVGAMAYVTILESLLREIKKTEEADKKAELIRDVREWQMQCYEVLIKACNTLLEYYPTP